MGRLRLRPRTRWKDRPLWALAVLVASSVVAYLVADDYYLDSAAFDCFPYCTFKQDLSNHVAGSAPAFGVLLVTVGAARWLRLGRRRATGPHGDLRRSDIAAAVLAIAAAVLLAYAALFHPPFT